MFPTIDLERQPVAFLQLTFVMFGFILAGLRRVHPRQWLGVG